MYILTVEDSFASAHQLDGYKGKCENLHGHNWRIVASVRGETLGETGLLVDFHELKSILKSITGDLDHINLNNHPHFSSINPSSENIARYIAEKMAAALKARYSMTVLLDSVEVWESDSSRCRFVP
jgi:6-pyruvoyltetrahydropterin/6-carboxytetrahydropterin synthase